MEIGDLDLLVLAGGLGTRLGDRLNGLPKVLAPVGGAPFLDHLLAIVSRQGIRRVVLALGFRAEAVVSHLNSRGGSMVEIVPVVETTALGTGGAIANALSAVKSDPVIVMNGDTFVDVDLAAFLEQHSRSTCLVSMACVRVPDTRRYGCVEIESDGTVSAFREKDAVAVSSSWINAGVYLFARGVVDGVSGSLERDILPKLPAGSIHAFKVNGRFLDIGTPADLIAADQFFFKHRPGSTK